MYRHSAALRMSPSLTNPSYPTQNAAEQADLEADICAELGRKRKQIDDEIAKFHIQKEQEFRDFEREVRVRRQRKRSPSARDRQARKSSTKFESGALGLLADKTQSQVNGTSEKATLQDRRSKTPPLSKPTLSLDKLTINGVSMPPRSETPPAALQKTLSRSPSGSQIALTPPRSRLAKRPPTPGPNDRNDASLAGYFTPSFLPLLDSRQDNPRASNPPVSEKAAENPRALPADQTLIPAVLPLQQAKRTLTAPALTSPTDFSPTSKPSALRTTSAGSLRKRKRVTLRLADSAIVEPSSSYEETATPSPKILSPSTEEDPLAREGAKYPSHRDDDGGAAARSDFHDADKKNATRLNGVIDDDEAAAEQEPDDEEGDPTLTLSRHSSHSSNNSDITHTRLRESFSSSSSPSPSSPSSSRTNLNRSNSGSSDGSASSGLVFDGQPPTPDGGSGVGFFELDEELTGPAPSGAGFPPSYPPLADEDGQEDGEEMEGPGPDADGAAHRGGAREDGGEGSGRGEEEGEGEEMKYGSFHAGSVPIDIASGRFLGNHAHRPELS